VLRPLTRKELIPVAPDTSVAYTTSQRQPMWPLTSHLELAAWPTAVACARRHARAITLEWGLAALADDVELVASELFTNAIRASAGLFTRSVATPVVRIFLGSDLRLLLIRVWDGNSQLPARRDAEPDDDSGRGLMLVEYLASEWGAYEKAHGKVVWALLEASHQPMRHSLASETRAAQAAAATESTGNER
jgi:anti-sigma regulatory factor (Ser/Thr protein kinase)